MEGRRFFRRPACQKSLFDKLVDGGASSPATATPSTHRNRSACAQVSAARRWEPKVPRRLVVPAKGSGTTAFQILLEFHEFWPQNLQGSDFSVAVASLKEPRPARTNPADSSPVLPAAAIHCSAAGASSKISRVVAVHAADHDLNAKGLRPSRALLGFFNSLYAPHKNCDGAFSFIFR